MRQFLIELVLYLANYWVNHIPFYTLRHFFYRHVCGMKLAPESAIQMRVRILGPRRIKVGSNSVINQGVLLDGRGGLDIGNRVSVSEGVSFFTADHDPYSENFAWRKRKIVVEDYVWIGSYALILPGITLGEGCCVGAGAVVTKDVQSYEIVAGNPAQLIGKREQNLRYEFKKFPLFN